MRKFLLAIMLLPFAGLFSQGKTLYGVALVQPKPGQSQAFETAWKTHLTKYHNGESKRTVYEIVSGDNTGTYQMIDGPFAYADLDKEMANEKVHGQDYLGTVSPKLDVDKEGYIYRWVDTLSYNFTGVTASKFVQTNYFVKQGKMADFMKEFKRSAVINEQIKSPSSYTVYVLMLAGSKSQLVIRSALKDGFKQLETNYLPPTTEAFKAAYIKQYGQGDWDANRAQGTGVYTFVDGYETYLVKARKDLSSTVSSTGK